MTSGELRAGRRTVEALALTRKRKNWIPAFAGMTSGELRAGRRTVEALALRSPAKKVTRWPKDSGSSGSKVTSKESYPLAEGQWKLWLSHVKERTGFRPAPE